MKLEFSTIDTGTPGDRYLTRLIIGRFRIHYFWRGDADRDPHDHQWSFWTLPLRTYLEEVYDPETNARSLNVVRAWRIHQRPAEYAHRVMYAVKHACRRDIELAYNCPDHEVVDGVVWVPSRKNIVTLVWFGSKERKWGFYRDAGEKTVKWVYWREYLEALGRKILEDAA